MRIIIVGAGAVGTFLAERLAGEGQDVVVIETNDRRVDEIRERLDALVITGNGASSSVLTEAGAERSDLLLAVSANDGANLLACHAAKTLGVKRTVARVQDPDLQEGIEGLSVDMVINPVESAAEEISTLVSESGVSELIDFGEGRLSLVGGTATGQSPLVGPPLSTLQNRVNGFGWLAIAVVRDGLTIVARGDTTIQEGDHLLLMVKTEHVDRAKELIGLNKREISRCLVVGSTRVASQTAQLLLEKGVDVVVIDRDRARSERMAEENPSALVITGDPTDPEVLGGFDITEDAVVALTGEDTTNLIASLVAKALGAPTTISRVTRMSYVGLLAGIGVDTTVSVRLAAANSILRFVRRGTIHSVVTFSDTDAEAVEFEVDSQCGIVGRTLNDIPLPSGAVVGGILREDQTLVPSGATEIRPRDHMIIFSLPSAMAEVESLFSR